MQDDIDCIDHIDHNDNDNRRFKISDDQSQSYDFRNKDFYHSDNLRIIKYMMIIFLTIVADISTRIFLFVSLFDYASEVVPVLTDF